MYGLEIGEKISRNQKFARIVRAKRQSLIDEAISWSGDTTKGKFDFHEIWKSDDGRYRVCLGKFGKEYYLTTLKRTDGTQGNNPNDMRPTVFIDGQEKEFDGSFDHVFSFFQEVSKIDDEALNVLGCLMYRNALLVDHVLIDNHYRYRPPKEAIDIIMEKFPQYDGIPTEVYIHYLEAIALNEDVKYRSLGYDVDSGTGRTNNMKTYAHIIAVLLGRASFAKLCSQFARPPVGVSAITNATAQTAFPYLNLE